MLNRQWSFGKIMSNNKKLPKYKIDNSVMVKKDLVHDGFFFPRGYIGKISRELIPYYDGGLDGFEVLFCINTNGAGVVLSMTLETIHEFLEKV